MDTLLSRPSVRHLAIGPTRERAGGLRESFLILSDVHLGSDLNDYLPEGEGVRRSRSVDHDLVELLHHYRRTAPQGDRWHLVIAGDFVDFIGISVRVDRDSAPGTLTTELSDEEREHGLGSAEDHALAKLRRVVERHGDVFRALAAFLSDGHALTIVHGNHDIEFHWDAVKNEFRNVLLLASLEQGKSHDLETRLAIEARIEFQPWFFYVGGVAYVEHGHQYDPYCATDLVMAPVSPIDPRRISRGFCDVLLRHVVRPTRGLKEYGHEHNGVLHYVVFAARLGFSGLIDLAMRFIGAVVALFRLRRESVSENAKTLEQEHERRMALLAEATRIGLDRLRALAALQSPPVTRSIRGILASVLLDRLALALLASASLCVLAMANAKTGHVLIAMICVILAWVVAHRYLERQRKIDPAEDMVDRAAKLARLFPAAFVVMGHTHMPACVPVNDGGSTYINVGSWAEEEDGDETSPISYRAARTHLVIHVEDGLPVAEFLTWDSKDGPKRFSA